MTQFPVSKRFACTFPQMGGYVEHLLRPLSGELAALVEEMERRDDVPAIQVSTMDAQHLYVLTSLLRPRKVVEIGTLFGLSGIFIARGLPEDGLLHTIEIDEKLAAIAGANFTRMGVAARIRQHVGRAIDVLDALSGEGPFDMVFIDADKRSYPDYLKWAARNLRPGGLLLADNTFAWGHLLDAEPHPDIAEDVRGIRTFNHVLGRSPLFRTTMLPTGEGLTLAVKVGGEAK